ncbi:MAG: LacI family DNA-binding transcriptional regulator [Bacteroidota bacterium]
MAADTITIYDIAAQAKVSIATVSRAFNNSNRVSPKTRDRVFAVAKTLGYHPNALARNLARQQSNLVSAVIPMMTSYFYLEVLQGVQTRIAKTEYDLLVYSAPELEDVEGLLQSALTRGKSEGVLLFSSPMDSGRVEMLKSREQPVVLVDQNHPDFDSVSIDNEEGGFWATEHLLSQGYKRLAMIMANRVSVPAMKRAEGFRIAHQKAGMAVDEQLVVENDDPAFHGYTEEAGYKAMGSLLEHHTPPDAVFATSDIQALGAKRAIEDAGLVVGRDIGLIGFDDIMISRYVGLSTLRQPMFDMGAKAAELLLQRFAEPTAPVTQTVFSPELVERCSSRKC